MRPRQQARSRLTASSCTHELIMALECSRCNIQRSHFCSGHRPEALHIAGEFNAADIAHWSLQKRPPKPEKVTEDREMPDGEPGDCQGIESLVVPSRLSCIAIIMPLNRFRTFVLTLSK